MSKLTPSQRALLRLLERPVYYAEGLPLRLAHKSTAAGLQRRGMAVVMADRLFVTTP